MELSKVTRDSEETTVLIIEDNASNFVLMARMLDHMGIHWEMVPKCCSSRFKGYWESDRGFSCNSNL